MAANKKPIDRPHLIASLNALTESFLDTKKNYQFYLVFEGHTPGVYNKWIDVLEQMKEFKNLRIKGFNNLDETKAATQSIIGPKYFIIQGLREVAIIDKGKEPITAQSLEQQHTDKEFFSFFVIIVKEFEKKRKRCLKKRWN